MQINIEKYIGPTRFGFKPSYIFIALLPVLAYAATTGALNLIASSGIDGPLILFEIKDKEGLIKLSPVDFSSVIIHEKSLRILYVASCIFYLFLALFAIFYSYKDVKKHNSNSAFSLLLLSCLIFAVVLFLFVMTKVLDPNPSETSPQKHWQHSSIPIDSKNNRSGNTLKTLDADKEEEIQKRVYIKFPHLQALENELKLVTSLSHNNLERIGKEWVQFSFSFALKGEGIKEPEYKIFKYIYNLLGLNTLKWNFSLYEKILNFFSLFVTLLIPTLVFAGISCVENEKEHDLVEGWKLSVTRFRHNLFLAATVLTAGLFFTTMWTQYSHIGLTGCEPCIPYKKALTDLSNSVVMYTGLTYSLVLIAYALPVGYILFKQAEIITLKQENDRKNKIGKKRNVFDADKKREELGLTVSMIDMIKSFLTLAAPLLTGFASGMLDAFQ